MNHFIRESGTHSRGLLRAHSAKYAYNIYKGALSHILCQCVKKGAHYSTLTTVPSPTLGPSRLPRLLFTTHYKVAQHEISYLFTLPRHGKVTEGACIAILAALGREKPFAWSALSSIQAPCIHARHRACHLRLAGRNNGRRRLCHLRR